MRKRYTVIALLLLTVCVESAAQSSIEENVVVRTSLDNMFANLDKSRVPTGYLLDYAVDLIDFTEYDGTELTDNNYANYYVLEDILRSIRSASVEEGDANIIPSAATKELHPLIAGKSVDVSIVAFKYNYIKSNALTDGLIEYNQSNGEVSDAWKDGVWMNPYGDAIVVAFSPVSNILDSKQITYNFPGDKLYKNIDIADIYFDAGDGIGYRKVTPGTSVAVNYSTDGQKELKLKIATSSGSVLEGHSIMRVMNAETYSSSSEVDAIPPYETITKSTTWNGITVSGQMTYYKKNGALKKPFIVVEGFDPWVLKKYVKEEDDDSQAQVRDERLGFTNCDSIACYFYDQNPFEGYDFVYIDWFNSTEDIRANAQLFVLMLREINSLKAAAGSTEKNIVMGQSMGGLVVRYALKTMENSGELHETATFISHDSPHLGANVPLGLLYFAHQLLSLSSGLSTIGNIATGGQFSEGQSAICDVLYSTAAKQMLVNYVDPSGNLDNSVHNDWQEELEQLGFPKGDGGEGIQNLSIVNGRAFDLSSALVYNKHFLYFDGYAKLSIWMELLTSVLSYAAGILLNSPVFQIASLLLGSSKIDAHIEVNPLSRSYAGQKIAELNANYTKKFLWCIPINFTLFSSTRYAPNTTLYYDDYPGSLYDLSEVPDFTDFSGGIVGEYSYTFACADKIMFIPTASALAIKGNLNPASFIIDYYLTFPEPGKVTPFNAYYLCDRARTHIYYEDEEIWNWISDQVNGKIEGPVYVTDEVEQYTLSGYDKAFSWSTSNEAIAMIDETGKLTPMGSGRVEVIAEASHDGCMFRKTKEIMVDYMPESVIEYSFIPGIGFRFTAVCVDPEDQSRREAAVAEGSLRYEWTLIDSNAERTTEISTSATFDYMPEEDEIVTVVLRMVDSKGNYGPMKSLRNIMLQQPMVSNYSYVVINGDNDVYFVKPDDTYDKGYPSESFAVELKEPAAGSGLSLQELYEQCLGDSDDCYISYRSNYVKATRVGVPPVCKWTIPFFDSEDFLSILELLYDDGMELFPGSPVIIDRVSSGSKISGVDISFTIYNSDNEEIQKIPFAVFYKEKFPETTISPGDGTDKPISGGGGLVKP